jgi:hypothetical protein
MTIRHFFGTVYIFLANSTITASGFCPEIPHQGWVQLLYTMPARLCGLESHGILAAMGLEHSLQSMTGEGCTCTSVPPFSGEHVPW